MTKQLASLNEKNDAKGDKKKFQIVLLGFDNSKEGNEGYIQTLNFPGLSVAGRKNAEKLMAIGDTGFLPNVVLVKSDGTLVSNDRTEVLKKLTELAEG